MHAELQMKILNTYSEHIVRLKKLWTHKLQLILFILTKHVPLQPIHGLKVFQGKAGTL